MPKVPVFIHNPKAASTSVRKVLRVKTAKIGGRGPHRHIHQPISTAFIQRQISKAFDEGKTPWVFGIVRDPLDRLISAWAYFKAPRNRAVPENYVLEALLQGMSFDDFIRAVDFEKISKHIPHFRTQAQYLIAPPGAVGIDQVLRFENINEDFSTLCRNLGTPEVPLTKERTSPRKDPKDYVLSPASRDKILDFYGIDYQTWGYEFQAA